MVLYMSYQRGLLSKSTLGNGLADQDDVRKVGAPHRLHFISFSLMYSGPLSTLMLPGLPRHSMMRSRLRMTRSTPARSRSASRQIAVQSPVSQWDKRVCGSMDAPSRCANAENTGRTPKSCGRRSNRSADRRFLHSRHAAWGHDDNRSRGHQRLGRPRRYWPLVAPLHARPSRGVEMAPSLFPRASFSK